jgi:hypothetical protein
LCVGERCEESERRLRLGKEKAVRQCRLRRTDSEGRTYWPPALFDAQRILEEG